MATYRVSEAGSNTSPYDTWAKAATTLATALTAATASGDVILIDKDHTGDNALGLNTTYTFGNHIAIICVDKDSSDAIAEMGTAAWIGNSSTSYMLSLAGAYKVFMHGLTFRCGGTGSTGRIVVASSGDGVHYALSSCYLWNGSSNSGALMVIGADSTINQYVQLKSCTLRFGHTGQGCQVYAGVRMAGCSVSTSGSAPTTLFPVTSRSGYFSAEACDFSYITGTLVGAQSLQTFVFQFENCRLGSGVTVLATQTPANLSSGHVWLYNCAYGDQHYHIGHYNAMGSTVVDTGIYANDGALYDGANHCSWKIVTSANCSFYTPYVSPWFSAYHSGTSAITPYVEILRDGLSTPYQNDEVWGEFSYQGTSGSPLGVLVDDRMTLLGTPADQDAGVGTSGWNTGAWSGKLAATASITPAEIGHLMARICVGEPSITVYVDPTIRGRS